jgi:hypothetical protein
LVEENLIGNVQRRALFSQVRQNPALDDWVKQGIDLVGSVESIQMRHFFVFWLLKIVSTKRVN